VGKRETITGKVKLYKDNLFTVDVRLNTEYGRQQRFYEGVCNGTICRLRNCVPEENQKIEIAKREKLGSLVLLVDSSGKKERQLLTRGNYARYSQHL